MRFHAITISAVVLILIVSAAPMRGQTIATTTTLTANPESILFGGFTMITATVTPASGPACALAGLPIQFFTAAGKPMTILDGAGQASIPYDYDPAGDNPATVSADFNYFNYDTSFAPSYGTVTLNVVPPAGILNGTYTFLFKGTVTPDGATVGNAVFALGALVADGNGNVTGEMDINSRLGAFFGPVKGTYSLSSSGQGTMTLSSQLGVQHFDIFAPGATFAKVATLVATDQNALFGSGTLTQQTGYSSNLFATSNYLLEILGETACNDCTSYGHPGGIVTGGGNGYLGFGGQPSSISEGIDETIGTVLVKGTSGHLISYPGNQGAADALGRLTLKLKLPADAPADQPANYAAYPTGSSHILAISIDTHATYMLLLQTFRQ